MIVLLLILWYLLGSMLGLYLFHLIDIYEPIDIKDIFIFLTLGGLLGLFTVFLTLKALIDINNWWGKKPL